MLSNIPVIGHLEGICHTYIDKDANLKMSKKVLYNAKLRILVYVVQQKLYLNKKIVKKFCQSNF